MPLPPPCTDRALTDRYERMRQAHYHGQVSHEMTLLTHQGMCGWMRGWQQVAAAVPAGANGGCSESAAEHGLTDIMRGMFVTEMVSIATAMISGKIFAKDKIV